MRFPIFVFLLLWGITIWQHGLLKATLPASFRIQAVCLSFLLILCGAYGINFLIWSLFHPSLLIEHFYVQMGAFPPLVVILVILFSTGNGFFKAMIGFDIVKQRRKARILAMRLLPFLVIADVLNVVVGVSGSAAVHPAGKEFATAVLILLYAAFYFWLYRFCSDKKNEELMTKPSTPAP